jgi:hypothetical protein
LISFVTFVVSFGVPKTKTPPLGEGPLQDEGLRYVFALAGVWSFLAGLLTFLSTLLARATLLLLTALFFFTPALVLRTVALATLLLATLLAHATLLTISFHVRLHFWGLH